MPADIHAHDRQHAPAHRLAGVGLIALGIGAAAGALLGPLVFGVIRWRISDNMESQLLGGDAVTLVLMAPLAIAAGLLWLRRHRLAPVLALGPALYGVYTFLLAPLVPEYDRYAGNNEKAFPLYVGLLILSWTLGAMAWSALGPAGLPAVPRRTRLTLAVGMLLAGVLIAAAWSGQIAGIMRGDVSLSDYQEHPGGFWGVKVLDLGFMVPLSLATGIGLLRNRPLAIRAAYGISGFLTLMLASIAAMAIVMLARDDPSASVAMVVVLVPLTALFALLTFGLYRTFLTGDVSAPTRAHPGAPATLRRIRKSAP